MKKVFYTTWVILFFCCGLILLGGKIKAAGRIFTLEYETDEMTFGDLYKMCLVDTYRKKINKTADGDMGGDDIQSYDIITYGDSFFRSKLETPRFADELARQTGKKVYYVDNDEYFGSHTNPLEFLKQKGYRKGKRALLIYEVVERYSIKNVGRLRDQQKGDGWQPDWKEKIFDNTDVDYFFKHNYLIKPVVRGIANLKFHLLDEIDPRIGRYSRKPRMLFYQESLDFHLSAKGGKEANMIAENIRFLQKELDETYNMDLIFMIIPNKYTLYGEYDPDPLPYDGFLGNVTAAFRGSGVPYVDVYGLYRQYRIMSDTHLLYYPNDTHYTPVGKKMILDHTVPLVKRLSQ